MTSAISFISEITLERILDICDKEQPLGVIISMGGQTPNNTALPLARGRSHYDASPGDIDRAENRHIFSRTLDAVSVDQPEWQELTSLEEAERFAAKVGYQY